MSDPTPQERLLHEERRARELQDLRCRIWAQPYLPWTDGLGDSELLG